MGAVGYRFRAELRARWKVWTGLALLVGTAGGLVVGIAAGARRTESAYDRFLAAQDAAEVVYANDGNEGFAVLDLDDIAALPEVREVARGTFHYVNIGPGIGAVVPGDDHFSRDVARWKLLDGRLPSAGAPDEAAISFALSDQYGLRVGDTFPMYDPGLDLPPDLPPEDLASYEEFKALADAFENQVRIVGTYAAPGQFPPQYGTGRLLVLLSPAFGETFGSPEDDALTPVALIRLRKDSSSGAIDRVVAELEAMAPEGTYLPVETQARTRDVLQRSLRVQANALWLLAVLAALGAVLVLGQVLARNSVYESAAANDLRALGCTRRELTSLGCMRAAFVASGAWFVAVIVAIALSPMFPRGLARIAEPEPGLDVDAGLVFGGAAGVGLVTALLVAIPVAWASRAHTSRGHAARGGRLAARAARLGLPVPGVTGAHFALVPGRGRRAVPVRTTLVAVALGVAVVVGALTFGASLDHLLDTPRLYGTTWDFALADWEAGMTASRADAAIANMAGVAAAAIGDGGIEVVVDGTRVDLFVAEPIVGEALPPMLEGRRPTAADEVALGARTMREIRAATGDTVAISLQNLADRRMEVVGTIVLPATSDRSGLGDGVFLTLDGLYRLVPQIAEFGGGVSYLFVDLAEGADRDATVTALRERLGDLAVVDARKPTELVDFGRVRGIPLVLGVVLAVMSVAALVHLLATAVRRRRADLALCRALGFSRRQLAATVSWQASITVSIALMVGVPVGLAIGRAAWAWLAHDLGVQFVARAPALAVGAVVLVGLAFANAAALLPARSASRTRPAAVLRAE